MRCNSKILHAYIILLWPQVSELSKFHFYNFMYKTHSTESPMCSGVCQGLELTVRGQFWALMHSLQRYRAGLSAYGPCGHVQGRARLTIVRLRRKSVMYTRLLKANPYTKMTTFVNLVVCFISFNQISSLKTKTKHQIN